MKKSKPLFFLFVGMFMLFCFFPFKIDYGLGNEKAFASEKTIESVTERRQGYFSGRNTIYEKNKTIKILIVPGHDDENSGAYFDGVREVDLNRELSRYLYNRLVVEPGFSVTLASDNGGYNNFLKNYFIQKETQIKEFIKNSQDDFKDKVKDGEIILNNKNFHNTAPEDVAFKLYGINMWLNENEYDFVFHIHFNDYPGRTKYNSPKYNGMAIYIPDKQFGNYEISRKVSEKIFDRLNNLNAVSNLEAEKTGIIEDQELIAIGSNDALDTSAILVEYGYIYEPQFTHPEIRKEILDDLAYQTYLGIKDFFGEKPTVTKNNKFLFKKDLEQGKDRKLDHYMLQKQLALLGVYPPLGKTLNDCPVAGYFGECTKEAVINFQKQNNLPTTGYVGEMTRKILNSL